LAWGFARMIAALLQAWLEANCNFVALDSY
jgi:hypothetical protein